MGYTKEELQTLRQQAVEEAWRREKELVLQGKGHRQWTVPQQMELITSDPPRVTGYEGSHILDVKGHPEYSGDPDNIQFLPEIAHFQGVHQHNFRVEPGEGLFNEETGEIIPLDKEGKIPEQEIFTLKDRVVHIQELDDLDRQKEQAELRERINQEKDPAERARLEKFLLPDNSTGQIEKNAEEGLSEANLAYTEKSLDQSGSYRSELDRESRASVRERDKVYGAFYDDADERNAKEEAKRERRAKKEQQENAAEASGSPIGQKNEKPGGDQTKAVNMAPQDSIDPSSEESKAREIDPSPGRSENNSQDNRPDERVTGEPGRTPNNTQSKGPDEKVDMAPDPRKTKVSAKGQENNSGKEPTMEPRESQQKGPDKGPVDQPDERVTPEPKTSQSQGSSQESGSDAGSSSGKSRDKGQSMSM